jgi:uncharacterized protein
MVDQKHAGEAWPSPVRLLVLQSTPFCNIDCSYCYLPDRIKRARMPREVVDAVVKKIIQAPIVGDSLEILWHAGEPLVLPISYYRECFDTILEGLPRKTTATLKIQTNGTLINQAWCDLFKSYGVQVGVSMDGPAGLHDSNRKFRTGVGTFRHALRSIQLLKENSIPFHVIAVLTAPALSLAQDIFSFFEQFGVTNIKFNVEEIEGVHPTTSLICAEAPGKYKEFFRQYWDWINLTGSGQRVREIHDMIERIMYPIDAPIDNHMAVPFACVSVGHQGHISTFSPELLGVSHPKYGHFIAGNILSDRLEDLLDRIRTSTFARDILKGVKECRDNCEYFSVCGGGCPSNKLWENGDFATTETLHCRLTIKAMVDVILDKLVVHRETML